MGRLRGAARVGARRVVRHRVLRTVGRTHHQQAGALMLVWSLAAIGIAFGGLWIAVRLTVIAARAIEQRSRKGAVKRVRRAS